ncbi:MAG: hypothetical protein CFK52_08130 [Chloracidobacterium sp. CP2_5A]|nr:MAG: hypothetical protein CFK52_08130 [Chloracidobacterium sp. CP2_5A]
MAYLRFIVAWLCLLTAFPVAQTAPDLKPRPRYGDPGYVGRRITFRCDGCSLSDVIQGILAKAGIRFEFPEAGLWQRVSDTVAVTDEPWNEALDKVLNRHELQATWSEVGRLVIARRMTPVAAGPGKLGQLLTGLPPVPPAVATLSQSSRAIEAERFFKEGLGYFRLANPDDSRVALARFGWATRIFDEIEYAGREASALYMLGASFLDLGQPGRAREAFAFARDFGRNAGNQRASLLSEASLAYLDLLDGQPDAAASAAKSGFDFVRSATARTKLSGRSLMDRELDALLITLAGRMFFRLGDLEAACQAFEMGFDAYLALDDGARGAIENAVWLQQAALRSGRAADAERAIRAGRSLLSAARSSRLQIAFLAWMGVVCGEAGDLDKAVELQREALDALRQSPDRTLETGLQWNLARTQAALRKYAEARRSYEAVLRLSEEGDDSFWRNQAQEALSRLP